MTLGMLLCGWPSKWAEALQIRTLGRRQSDNGYSRSNNDHSRSDNGYSRSNNDDSRSNNDHPRSNNGSSRRRFERQVPKYQARVASGVPPWISRTMCEAPMPLHCRTVRRPLARPPAGLRARP